MYDAFSSFAVIISMDNKQTDAFKNITGFGGGNSSIQGKNVKIVLARNLVYNI